MNLLKPFFILAALAVGFNSHGQNCIPAKPSPPKLVNDFADILSSQEEQSLEVLLVNFNDTTSTQIAVVTVKDLCDYDAASFTYEIGETWGVGNAKFDNGVVLMVKPKYSNSKGQVFIATGYGLEGVLPDATSKRIVENEIIPFFRNNDYYGGIASGISVIIGIVGGEYSANNYNQGKHKPFPFFPFLFILFFVVIMFASTFRRARAYSQTNNVGLLAALMLMGSMNGRHRGSYNNFRSGGGGFGGSSGGFGGFGGGSFGGGGAGGSW